MKVTIKSIMQSNPTEEEITIVRKYMSYQYSMIMTVKDTFRLRDLGCSTGFVFSLVSNCSCKLSTLGYWYAKVVDKKQQALRLST